MNNFGWLSILPPIIAIVLALITKEVLSSLLIGILAGALIFTNGSILAALETIFNLMGQRIGGNALMVVFLALLGCLVAVVTRAGGAKAYGDWASRRINSRSKAQFATGFLGCLIFIDDYFNCLTVGTVMRPVTDKQGVSRAKLAYLIDSTAAPICIIAPISSWAASVASAIEDAGIDNGLAVFIKTIPFNLYAILTLVCVFYFCFAKHDVGPMRKFETNDTSKTDSEASLSVKISERGTVLDLVIPIVALIAFVIFFMLRTGGYFSGEGISIDAAFGDASTNLSLAVGAILAIIVAFVLYLPRKLMTFTEFMDAMYDGVKSMVPAIMILSLAWTIGGICNDEFLNTGGFVGDLIVNNNVPLSIIPPVIFFAAACLAFSTGTAWGTFLLLVPIMVPVIQRINAMEYLNLVLAAIFSGSVFGDHCSPISDTTILSSAGAGCNHIDHVATQIPYALTVAASCLVGFIAGGLTNNAVVTLAVGIITLFVILFLLNKLYDPNKQKKTA